MTIILIHADNCISSAHYYLPNYFFCCVLQVKVTKLWNFWAVFLIFHVQKIAYVHLDLLQTPFFENISEIFSKNHSAKAIIFIKHIYPKTTMGFSQISKSNWKFFCSIHCPLFEAIALKKGFDGDVRANLSWWLVSDSEKIEKDIFKIDDRDHHAWINIFY